MFFRWFFIHLQFEKNEDWKKSTTYPYGLEFIFLSFFIFRNLGDEPNGLKQI